MYKFISFTVQFVLMLYIEVIQVHTTFRSFLDEMYISSTQTEV